VSLARNFLKAPVELRKQKPVGPLIEAMFPAIVLISVLFALNVQLCDGWLPRRRVHQRRSKRKICSSSCLPEMTESSNDQAVSPLIPTTMLLNVSYDGGRFTGWSAQNEAEAEAVKNNSSSSPTQSVRARRRTKEIRGFVRSVEGVLRFNLARVMGDIDPDRIVIEACSRTDKGVHAQSMICQIYSLAEEYNTTDLSIPGKRIPHPRSTNDTSSFIPIPKNCTQLMSILNRMCADDVKVRAIALTPTKSDALLPFHPTLDCAGKTYEYTISVGPIHDPTSWRRTWHLEHADSLDVLAMQEACRQLEGTHDFVAFRGAPRGKDDKMRQEKERTICTLHSIELRSESQESLFPDFEVPLMQYTLTVQGDRFLYKMMRFITGVLVAVGTHKLDIETVISALENGVWNLEGRFQCAPPQGLVLKHVKFNEEIQLDWVN
jgi:tRNA pseudouridine(38-40) synthase